VTTRAGRPLPADSMAARAARASAPVGSGVTPVRTQSTKSASSAVAMAPLSKRRLKPTCSGTPAALVAAMARSASLR
jgi:hypothetical protein